MKKQGFTLIELLAVIVILAIIALIATPIVMNVIENSRKGAAERSAENYIDAVETAIATERLDNKILEGEYTIQSDGNLCPVAGCGNNNKDKVNIDMSGNKPKEGTILIENGLVVDKLSNDATKKTSIKTKDDYTVSYNEEGKLEATKGNTESSKKEVFRKSDTEVYIGDDLSSFEYVEDPSDLGNKYLKHTIENNKVTESYACVVFGDTPVCLRGGSGDYYGYTEDSANYTGNVSILKGLEANGAGCQIFASSSNCFKFTYYLNADQNGNVDSSDDYGYCYVNGEDNGEDNGSSACLSF